MNTRQKKQYINDFKKILHYHRFDKDYLQFNYDKWQKEYNETIERNQRLYFNGFKIPKIETEFIIEVFQIITDCYIYKIDPLTNCHYER